MADEKKGITVKIDAELHAQVKEYIDQHGMTMAEFVSLALDDELHHKFEQKEKNNMGNMRTIAFQVPEELFQRIKDYLHRNNISQKGFVLGLIEDELDREHAERENITEDEQTYEKDEEEALQEDETDEDFEPVDISEGIDIPDENTHQDEGEYESEDIGESKGETVGFLMGM